MDFQATEPRDAASIILMSDDGTRVLWAQRNPALKFLGGFHSFPGGKVDDDDSNVTVKNCNDCERRVLIACAARETFEETGVLLVRNGLKLTTGQIVSLHDDLVSERSTFSEILDHWKLWLDADDFEFAGVWITPEFSRMRYRTSFFVANCPSKQVPYAAISELLDVEFIESSSALDRWSRAESLMAPPLLGALRALKASDSDSQNKEIARRCIESADIAGMMPASIELNPRFTCLPLRTKTLPPATHTNCFIVGNKRFVVIDAATPYEDEQRKLFEFVDQIIESGGICEAIVVSHLHPDHFGGETALKLHLKKKFDLDIPIAGHPRTIESLDGKVRFDSATSDTFILTSDTFILQDRFGKAFDLELLHTPGHARGHLCFYDREFGFLLSSDNVVGEGSVLIAPPEGNMIDYLSSLELMKSLPGLRSLAGSHGAAIHDAVSKIESYIEHRLKREADIETAISKGASSISDLVDVVYEGLDPQLLPLAAKSVEAHLEKLSAEKSIPVWFKAASGSQN